jgi:anti-sigma B factor antagonist
MMDPEQALISDSELRVDGEMTIYRASEVARTLLAAIAAHKGNVSLDLSAVTEFDTAGLQLVLMAQRLAESHGHHLHVVRPSECVAEVLGLCNLSLVADSQQAAS